MDMMKEHLVRVRDHHAGALIGAVIAMWGEQSVILSHILAGMLSSPYISFTLFDGRSSAKRL